MAAGRRCLLTRDVKFGPVALRGGRWHHTSTFAECEGCAASAQRVSIYLQNEMQNETEVASCESLLLHYTVASAPPASGLVMIHPQKRTRQHFVLIMSFVGNKQEKDQSVFNEHRSHRSLLSPRDLYLSNSSSLNPVITQDL